MRFYGDKRIDCFENGIGPYGVSHGVPGKEVNGDADCGGFVAVLVTPAADEQAARSPAATRTTRVPRAFPGLRPGAPSRRVAWASTAGKSTGAPLW